MYEQHLPSPQPIPNHSDSSLQEALEDFYLSRRGTRCTPSTLQHYRYSAGIFVTWLQARGVTDPKDVRASHVYEWLAQDADRLKDTALHARARGVKTFLRFLHFDRKVMPELVRFKMPRLEKRRLPCLEPDQVRELLRISNARQKAIIHLLSDSGVRAAELCNLNWGDLNPQTGQLFVRRGKGRKDRMTAVCPMTIRVLLAYRRTLKQPPTPDSPMIRGRGSQRLTPDWLSHLMRRLGMSVGIHVTPHMLRRTFALMSLRSGMDLRSLQGLMGHSTIEMTAHYAQLLDADLLSAHAAHGLDAWL